MNYSMSPTAGHTTLLYNFTANMILLMVKTAQGPRFVLRIEESGQVFTTKDLTQATEWTVASARLLDSIGFESQGVDLRFLQ